MTPQQYRAAMGQCGWYITVGRRGGQCAEPFEHITAGTGHRLATADPADAVEVEGYGSLQRGRP